MDQVIMTNGGYLFASLLLVSCIIDLDAIKCYQCVYFSNLSEDEPLRYQQKQLSVFTKGYYDTDLFYQMKNTRKCFTGPTSAEESTVQLSDCPDMCKTYYREENNGKYVVIRSCSKTTSCYNDMFVDDAEARQSKCCSDDLCNNEGTVRATRCHQCLYNKNLTEGETLKKHHKKYGSSRTGISPTDVERLGFQSSIPHQEVCKTNPWDTDQVLCPSKTCSKLEFVRSREGARSSAIHTIVRDCLKQGKYCETDIKDGSIACCMENVCNRATILSLNWTSLFVVFLGLILIHKF